MKRVWVIGVAACCAVGVQPAVGQEALDGRWAGSLEVAGQMLTIAVDFETGNDSLKATIDIPEQGASGVPLTNVSYDPPRVHMELPAGPGLAVFDGERDGDSIAGAFTQAGFVGSFALVREAEESETGNSSEHAPMQRTIRY